jgi:hypothetical protein
MKTKTGNLWKKLTIERRFRDKLYNKDIRKQTMFKTVYVEIQ